MAETKYKQTEVGLIPEDWECRSIGEVGNTYAGLTGKSKQDFVKGNALYITFLNVLNNPILKPELFESVYVGVNERQNKAQRGDLFFNTSSETPEEVGICAMLDEDFRNLYLNSFCFGYRLKDNSILPLFLSYYFRSGMGRRMMTAAAQGVTRYNLSKSTFNKIKIPLPPLAEQHAIASALTSIDNLITSLDKQIAKTQSVKQGAMQQLFSSLNEEPLKPLEVIAIIDKGVQFNKANMNEKGTYPVINGGIDASGYIERYNREGKTITISQGGESAGYVNWQMSKFWAGAHCYIVKPKDNTIINKYLYYFIKFNQSTFMKSKYGGNIPALAISTLLNFLVPIPSIETQHRIASTLTAIDDQISALEAERKKYEMVKVGMMQQLLTGKIRLK